MSSFHRSCQKTRRHSINKRRVELSRSVLLRLYKFKVYTIDSVSRGRIYLAIKHNMTEGKLKLYLDYELTKYTSYLTFTGELRCIFCDISGEDITWDIESVPADIIWLWVIISEYKTRLWMILLVDIYASLGLNELKETLVGGLVSLSTLCCQNWSIEFPCTWDT